MSHAIATMNKVNGAPLAGTPDEQTPALIEQKLGNAVVKVANKFDWTIEQRQQAAAYIKKLTRGTNTSAANTKNMDKAVRRSVEQRFATTCWLNRRIVGDLELPGMRHSFYRNDYHGAMQRYPASA